MIVHEAAPPGAGEAGYQSRHRFLFNHLVLGNSEVSRELARLPRDRFKDVRGEGWNCWRVETADGRRFTARDWEIEEVLEGSILLQRDYGSTIRSKPKDNPPRTLELDHIQALWPMPLRKGNEVVLAARLALDGADIRVTDVYGVEHRGAPGEFVLIPLGTQPDYGAYGFDRKGEAAGLDTESIESFLRDPGKAVSAAGWVSVPLSKITRWEFEKEWRPTAVLVTFGLQLPLQAMVLESNPGEPGRCAWD